MCGGSRKGIDRYGTKEIKKIIFQVINYTCSINQPLLAHYPGKANMYIFVLLSLGNYVFPLYSLSNLFPTTSFQMGLSIVEWFISLKF